MRIKRQINKQNNIIKKTKINDKQIARYTKIRDEIKDLNKEELQKLLISKPMSKTDRAAIIHSIYTLKEKELQELKDRQDEGSTHNNNALSGEDTNIQQEST